MLLMSAHWLGDLSGVVQASDSAPGVAHRHPTQSEPSHRQRFGFRYTTQREIWTWQSGTGDD
jgi:hypothetical protein